MLALPIDALGGQDLTGGEEDPLPARTWTTAEAPAVRRGATMYIGVLLADCEMRVLDHLTTLAQAERDELSGVLEIESAGWEDPGGTAVWPRGRALVETAQNWVEAETMTEYGTATEE